MPHTLTRKLLLWILFWIVLEGGVLSVDWDEITPLDEYVWKDDGYFSWEQIGHYEYDQVDLYFLNMTSQYWIDENFSNHPLWYHWVIIAIPHTIEYEDAAVMAIDGGTSRPDADLPEKDHWGNLAAVYAANETKSVVGFVRYIPNQPIIFNNDPSGQERKEDSLIAWTWREFLENGATNPEVVARLPMTKGAKRGLDTINEFVLEKTGNNVTRFAVGGASKRGWTTWSLAAVDRRVIAIAPLVMSLLNFPETLMHHFQSMDAAWSFALAPYYNENLTYYFMDPIADELWKHEDPYTYKERLTIPKLVISATGDEFFLLTDSHHWWNDLPGDIWFMMNPNSEHSLAPHYIAIGRNVIAGWKAVLDGYEMPKVSWDRENFPGGGRLIMRTTQVPTNVIAFRAETLQNNTRRDFRLAEGVPGDIQLQPVWWRRNNVTETDEYTFVYEEEEVDDEWVGILIQAEFDGPDGFTFRFTTEVNVIPDTFPAEPCTGDDCYGYLV